MNSDAKQPPTSAPTAGRPLLVWDLPTRLFHWLLLILVTVSFVTGYLGGLWMRYHVWSGCSILGLLVFRLVWGFVGGRYARFSAFVRGPATALRYARAMLRRESSRYPGHNPLGGWSVMAMLTVLLVQATTGLFATDDIFTKGPLYPWVSDATSHWLTHIHMLNQEVILLLVSLHVAAVLFYLIIKRENLIKPMLTGHKQWHGEDRASTDHFGWAALIAGIIAVGVYLLGSYR
jgi:cytochrome b